MSAILGHQNQLLYLSTNINFQTLINKHRKFQKRRMPINWKETIFNDFLNMHCKEFLFKKVPSYNIKEFKRLEEANFLLAEIKTLFEEVLMMSIKVICKFLNLKYELLSNFHT